MPKKKRDGWGENGFEDWGGYMAAKKAKLEEQFRDTAKKEFKESKESSQLFKGIAIFVNGYTEPTSDELRRLMMMHGGIYHHYMRPKITTHIIASNLPYSKIMLYKKSQNPIPICKPQWIIDSIAAGSVLNFQNYLLYSNSTDVQPQLAYKLNNKSKDSTNFVAHNKPDNIIEKPETSVNNKTDINRKNSSKHNVVNDASKEIITNSNQSLNTKTSAQSTKDAEFLSTFYSNSRLHYISTMGTMFKDYVNELRDKSDGVFSGLQRLIKLNSTKNASTSVGCELDFEDETICFADKITTKANDKQSIIMHIDMDCFFVSVGIKNRPELQNVPVAVTHAKGNTFSANYNGKEEFGSMSEVASCSYAARKAGVKNGMFLGEALKLCPNLTTIQYDFEGYKEVSYILYDTVASYTLDIEAVSCDEMYVDCTKILETSGLLPLEFATIIRNEIKQKTDCPVSTGFGNNKLQARLATRKAKPDNQFYFSGQNAETYIRTFNIRDLPGVGGTTSYKLHKMNVHTCEDLQRISLGVLQKEFGKKMGEQLYKMCRGIDDTKLNLEYIRKSVSAEVNYGIRFQNNGDAVDFLSELSVEVCNRLTLARAKGRCITLKLMVRAEEAPKEAAKFMGHGLCNYITKSKNLIAAVNDINIIKKEVINIWNQLHLIPEDMRGIGIQISRLEMYKTKQAKSNLINFFNKTKKSQQTYDKMLEDDNKDHCVSEKSKSDCSEMSPTTKPSLERKICDAEINNLLPESAKNSELIDSAIPIDVQVEPLTAKLKNKSKVNENTRAKDLFEKSNKKVLQKQTSQENFFKQVKPNSGKLSKCDIEIPQIQDIDMSVLIELPTDIRNEILDEYKRNKKQSRMNTTVDSINEMLHDEENTNVQNCSQVDPDTLLALMESNLHPDVQRDVQMYCNMKKKTNRANFIETNKKSDSKQLQEVDASKISDNKENAILNVNSICKDKAERIALENTMHAADQLGKNGDTTEANHIPCQINRVETSNKNIAINKTDICILQNLSILHNNEKVDKHQEMLINLVNHLFTLPLQQIKLQIQTWVTKSNIVNEVDFLSLATFLSMLPEKKRIEDLHVLLKTMYRCTTKTGNCIWHRTYRRTVKHVQRYMQIEYNNNLMIPLIRCNDPRCNNN